MDTQGSTTEKNRTNKTREAKLNMIHTRERSKKIKQEVTHTETQTKTHELDTETGARQRHD